MKLKEKIMSSEKLYWTCVIVGVALLATLLIVGTIVLIEVFWPKSSEDPQAPASPATQAPPVEPEPEPPKKTTLKPQDFQYDGDFLTCIAAPAQLGVDVSSHRGQIDWQAVKEAGVTFAIIRVGGRGYGAKGVLYTDDYAKQNYEGARAAGIKVGVYFFSQATSVAEAKEEAALVLEFIQDWELDFPVVYDWERMEAEDSRTLNVDARTVTDCMKAFCAEIEKTGRQAMIYFNPDHAAEMFYIEEVTTYDFWLAYYTDWMDYPYKVDMWQYTNTGTVPGIPGEADINLYFPEADSYTAG